LQVLSPAEVEILYFTALFFLLAQTRVAICGELASLFSFCAFFAKRKSGIKIFMQFNK